MNLFGHRNAYFSPCRTWRYSLMICWQPGPMGCFIGLNPSTADEVNDDPTIRRCRDFAARWGCGSMLMLNLFAYRATDPKVMKLAQDPIGPWGIPFYERPRLSTPKPLPEPPKEQA